MVAGRLTFVGRVRSPFPRLSGSPVYRQLFHGLGAHIGAQVVSAVWSKEERELHIKVLEFRAAWC